MAAQTPRPRGIVPAGGRFLPLLLLLFVASGCAALIYEVAWFQLLQLVIGSSALSMAVLFGTFMGGMCAGSLLLPRFLTPQRHPLRLYAAIELGIGLIGIALLRLLPMLAAWSDAVGGGGLLLRALTATVCLVPPTLLMGATLPAIARWVESAPDAVPWLGLLYAGNIVGGVLGCLLAGFYLLRVHDVVTATFVAAGLNLGVAAIGAAMAARSPHAAISTGPPSTRAHGRWAVYVAIGLSGMSALGAEVIWTRILSLLLGGTVYTFSLILAVFLVGLGAGSGAGAALARSVARPRLALAWCQMLLALGIAWTAYVLTHSLPYWPIIPWLVPSPWISFQVDFVRCLVSVLPPALFWGASFPLALAAAASPGEDSGRLVGNVYAANTVGAILGAVGFSLFGIVLLGTRHGQQLLICLALSAALLMLVQSLRRELPTRSADGRLGRSTAGVASLAAAGVLAGLLAGRVAELPPGVVGYGRFLSYMTSFGLPDFLYVGEGMNSSIAVSLSPDGKRNFHVSGKVEASTDLEDMRLQRLLGHMSALAHPAPRSVLVVGFGAGVTAGTFLTHPGVERIVVVEIEPLIPRAVGPYFAAQNYDVLSDPRVEIVYDDTRHYLLTTDETFDVITSDPIHPWVKGAGALYTTEYFELIKRRLKPGGVVTQWLPLYESSEEVVRSELATFFEVFPMGTAWSNYASWIASHGHDVVLLAKTGPLAFDLDALQARLERPDHAVVLASLQEVGFAQTSATELLATYVGRGPDLQPWLAGAQINRDRNLRLQYLAGMALDVHLEEQIYMTLMALRRYPADLFTGSDAEVQKLKRLLEDQQAQLAKPPGT